MKASEIRQVIEDRGNVRGNRLGMSRDVSDWPCGKPGFAEQVEGCYPREFRFDDAGVFRLS